MTSKNKIIEAIEAAQGSWTGSDWEHKVDIAEREVYEYSTIDEDDQEVRLDDALEAVTIASRLESYYGDDPTWGEPRRLLEAAASEELK